MSHREPKETAQHPKNLRPRWFVPEVVQTSAMDCGPAALKCLLEGFGIPVSYGRLREICQTDVDGTSIDTLEEIAQQLGLPVEQVVVPADHVLLPETKLLPALAVVQHPNGLTHFVIIWRRLGNLVQVMDPASGRVWKSTQQVLQELYLHAIPVEPAAWRAWAETGDFLAGLYVRLARLGLSKTAVEHLVELGLHDTHWHTLATLDASTRLVTSLIQKGGIKRGPEAERLLSAFFEQACLEDPNVESKLIPSNYWSVRPLPPMVPVAKEEEQEEEDLQILLRGAVLLRILPPSEMTEDDDEQAVTTTSDTANQAPDGAVADEETSTTELPLAPELVTALQESSSRPGLVLLQLLIADGFLTPITVIMTLLLAAGGTVIEALLLRGLLDIGQNLSQVGQRLIAILSLLIFMALITGLDALNIGSLLQMGRRLEIRLRGAILERIPQMHDRYFQSRLVSDMAERSHSIYQIRLLPTMVGKLLRLLFELWLTVLGLIWLDPASTPLIILLGLYGVSLPFLPQPFILGRELKVRTHNGALSRFYMDGLRGLTAIRTHKAERAVRREHEKLLASWVQATYRLHLVKTVLEALQFTVIIGLIGWLVLDHLSRPDTIGSALLFVYWAIAIWLIAVQIAPLARQYPTYRNITLRLLEMLTTPTGNEKATPNQPAAEKGTTAKENPAQPTLEIAPDMLPIVRPDNAMEDRRGSGVSIKLENVSVQAAGHPILHHIDLDIEAGSHLAIIGPSGAGKSSLVGLLLGWHTAMEGGSVLLDGAVLDTERLQRLRQDTAWVDPAVQLWNRSLLDNLHYGLIDPFTSGDITQNMSQVITQADLVGILERLPAGLQTQLGEGGALVSGGEGQRVRLGRAMLRPHSKLVILDEPFRGLDREKRHELLAYARQLWRDATLLCITHDVSETAQFDRVVVLEGGQLVEDGVPATLAADPDSRYRALLNAEMAVRESFWASTQWRKLYVANGQVSDNSSTNHNQITNNYNHSHNNNHNKLVGTEGYYAAPNQNTHIN